jgi:hypothetical protein
MSKTDTSKDDAKAILESLSLPSLKFPSRENWKVPSRTQFLYYRLKSNAKYFLNNDVEISIEKIKANLVSVFKLVGIGKEHFQLELELRDFDIPPVIYLEYLRRDQSGQDWPQDFYIGYILLAMLDVVEFENMITLLSSSIPQDNLEIDSKLLKAVSVLLDAQVSLELGISAYEENRGDTYFDRYNYLLENYSAGIRAESGLKRSNKQKSEDARDKWRPLILKVIGIGNALPLDKKRWVTSACLEVVGIHEMSVSDAEVLRRNYYKYIKDPENY